MSAQPDGPIDIYARQSREDDDRQRSPEGQVTDCRAVLADRGLTVGEVHIDPGLSAWNPRVKRPGWDALMARLESGEAAGVVVFDLERFSRQPDDGSRLIRLAERGNIVVLDSEAEFDVMSASGRKAFRDALNVAEYYSMRLSTRVSRGKRLKALRGEPNGSSRPFGFEPDLVTIREDEAAILRDLTARFLDGEPQDVLIAGLNRRGITTSYGKPWTRAGLRQLLTRERNCGRIVYKGTVTGKLPGDPVISEDDFERVRSMYAARRRGRPSSPLYLCSGFAICGMPACGKRLHGRPRANMRPYADGGVRREYWCGPYSMGGCGRIAVDQRGLDEAARVLAITILADPGHAAAVEAAARGRADQAAKLDLEIAEAEDTAEQLAVRLGHGEITLARYDAATKPLDDRIAKLRARRQALAVTDAPAPDAAAWVEWEHRWSTGQPHERRSMLKMALRGRMIAVGPADRVKRGDVRRRITLVEKIFS